MKLSDLFTALVHKELVAVDLPSAKQHELNGVAALRDLFGTTETTAGRIGWRYFADDCEPVAEETEFKFYDARAKGAARTGRSEWRFYYHGEFLNRASPGDLLILARSVGGAWFGLVFARDSAWWRAARELLHLGSFQSTFDLLLRRDLDERRVEFLGRQILAALDLELALPVEPSDEERVMRQFPGGFPRTREMSEFARLQVPAEEATSEPDRTLVAWLEREEQLFRALENVLIRERLVQGFGTVDEFLQYSLSVQNRRKSRMGHALQNHLVELFQRHQLRFTAQARTEGGNRPDFVFPGEDAYRAAEFETGRLLMLGVKSSSKDRWRQVLTEADRIPAKHLCTLEPGISVRQTEEMRRQRLTLVIPAGLHGTFTPAQRAELLSLAEFIDRVRRTQG